MIFVHL